MLNPILVHFTLIVNKIISLPSKDLKENMIVTSKCKNSYLFIWVSFSGVCMVDLIVNVSPQLVILGVWITSAAYSAPKFIFVETMTNDLGDGHVETFCAPQRRKYNSELFDMVNFGLLYVTPLCVMTVS